MPQLTASFAPSRRRKLSLFPLLLILPWLLFCHGCATTSGAQKNTEDSPSFLELQVHPTSAEIYIDDEYQGLVEGWRHQTVPIQPGYRRLELRASKFITQRFDLDVNPGELLTLTVRLEASTGISDDDEPPQRAPGEAPPAFPAHRGSPDL